jgi:MFS family permease
VVANSFGWGAIIGLNIFLPMYLQSVIGLSATSAGLSLMVLMVTLNTSAGVGGQIVGRVKHYKTLPMAALTLAIASVIVLAVWADSLTWWSFELLLFLIGLGFGPMPSMNAVVVQNSVARHQLGIAVGTMSFGRNLFGTMLVALLGVLVLAGGSTITPGGPGPGHLGDALSPDAAQAAAVFARVFYAVAASLAVAFVALVLIEEKPLQTNAVPETK